jgi:nucleoporin NUP42
MPNLTGQTVHDPTTKKLRTWKGQPVTYVSEDNPCYAHPEDPTILVHIFFPDGPPLATTLKDAQAKDGEYTPDVEAAYKFAKQHGHFKDGLIPKVPPKTEWCSFDF